MNKKTFQGSPKVKARKKAMFETLVKNLGKVTKSAEEVGIKRLTHYEWIRKDPYYKELIDSIDEYQVDFYEQALDALVEKGNPTATIFALKCKGKDRGWTEKQEIEHSGGLSSDHKLQVEFVSNKEETSEQDENE